MCVITLLWKPYSVVGISDDWVQTAKKYRFFCVLVICFKRGRGIHLVIDYSFLFHHVSWPKLCARWTSLIWSILQCLANAASIQWIHTCKDSDHSRVFTKRCFSSMNTNPGILRLLLLLYCIPLDCPNVCLQGEMWILFQLQWNLNHTFMLMMMITAIEYKLFRLIFNWIISSQYIWQIFT
jgi:hypothetical protein